MGPLVSMISKRVLLLLGALGWASLAWSQDMGEWTDSYVKALAPAKHFRGTIVVERNGQRLIQKNYGIAVEEWQIPVSSDTRFEIASLSKQFTAAAILQLADTGKLNVEDSVSKYYTDSSPAWKGMTIHHLLTHTSGLPENEWENFYKGRATPYTTEEQVKTFRDRPLDFPPGTAWKYRNTEYILQATTELDGSLNAYHQTTHPLRSARLHRDELAGQRRRCRCHQSRPVSIPQSEAGAQAVHYLLASKGS